MNLIELKNISKMFETPAGPFTALSKVNLSVKAGEFLAVVGKSGSGKSTLLNLLVGIDRPTQGEVIVAGTPVHTLTQDQLSAWRGRSVGVVFQFFQLLPTLTVAENVMLPMDFCNTYPARESQPPREFYAGREHLRQCAHRSRLHINFTLLAMSLLMATVGVLGLVSALGTSVLERTREFGIMRTLGGRTCTILRNIIGEGVFIGLLSWGIAVVLSLPLSASVGRLIGNMAFRSPLELAKQVHQPRSHGN